MPSKLNYEYVQQVFAEKGYTLISKIPLVRIPYWDMDNGKYKEILTNIIKG